jgi:hypothetical protein
MLCFRGSVSAQVSIVDASANFIVERDRGSDAQRKAPIARYGCGSRGLSPPPNAPTNGAHRTPHWRRQARSGFGINNHR